MAPHKGNQYRQAGYFGEICTGIMGHTVEHLSKPVGDVHGHSFEVPAVEWPEQGSRLSPHLVKHEVYQPTAGQGWGSVLSGLQTPPDSGRQYNDA